MSIGLFYGSSGGNTEGVAKKIAEKFEIEACDIGSASIEDLLQHDTLILGTSTWGQGDLQDDWDSFLPNLENADFSGKTVALFGLGDQEMYPDEFADGVASIHEALKGDVKRVGFWEDDNYEYDDTRTFVDGKFVGLIIDEDNQDDLTDDRIEKWVKQLKSEI